jgi:hypothetical protein
MVPRELENPIYIKYVLRLLLLKMNTKKLWKHKSSPAYQMFKYSLK